MDNIKKIEAKIFSLEKKRKEVVGKISKSLLDESKKILGDDFSPELVLGILESEWKNSGDLKKKEWLKESEKFRKKRKPKKSKSPHKNRTED